MNFKIRLITNLGFTCLLAFSFVLVIQNYQALTEILISGFLFPALILTVLGRMVDHQNNHLPAKIGALLVSVMSLLLFVWFRNAYFLSIALVLCFWSGHLLHHPTDKEQQDVRWAFSGGLFVAAAVIWFFFKWPQSFDLFLQVAFWLLLALFSALIIWAIKTDEKVPSTSQSMAPGPFKDLRVLTIMHALSFMIPGFVLKLQASWGLPAWPWLAAAATLGILISRWNIPTLGHKRSLALTYLILMGLFFYDLRGLQDMERTFFLGFYLALFCAERWTVTSLYKRSLPLNQSAYFTGFLLLSSLLGFIVGYHLEIGTGSRALPIVTLVILMILNQTIYPERASAVARNQPINETPWGNAWNSPDQEAPILSLNTWMKYLQRTLCELFFGKIRVRGLKNLENLESALFIANHPNTFFDPLLISAVMPYPLKFLAKSTLWKIPILGPLMDHFGLIPVQRAVDTRHSERRKNVKSLEKSAQLLCKGSKILIFPEGVSQAGLTLKPIKTGAARILFNALEISKWEKDIPIIPLGIDYEKPSIFRSSVTLRIGKPISLIDRKDEYKGAPRNQVIEATHLLSKSLIQLIPHIESEQKEELVKDITELYGSQLCQVLQTTDTSHARMEIVKAVEHYCDTDPSSVQKLQERLATFQSTCKHLNFSEETQGLSFSNLIQYAKAVISPPAIGLLLHWLPYKVTQKTVALMPMDEVWQASAKLGVGVAIYPLYYFILHTIFAFSLGALPAYILIASIVLLGFMALGNFNRYDFMFQPLETIWHAYWNRDTHEDICRMKAQLLQDLERFREAYSFYLEEMELQ